MKIVIIGNGSAAIKALEAMAHYREFVYVKVNKARSKGKVNEGAYMIFHEHTLEKV